MLERLSGHTIYYAQENPGGGYLQKDKIRASAVIRKFGDIEKLKGADVEKIRLSFQPVTNKRTIENLLRVFPSLKTISIPPSAQRMIGRKTKELLLERGIELEIKRVRVSVFYDKQAIKGYEEKRAFFRKLLSDNKEGKQIFLKMKRHGLEGVKWLENYLGKDRNSLLKIAKTEGEHYQNINRKVAVALEALGFESNNPSHQEAAINLLKRLDKFEKKQEEIRKYSVEGFFPPQKLPASRLQRWQTIEEIRRNHPERWRLAEKKLPEELSLLKKYYQIGEFRDKKKTLENLGNELGITREAIRMKIAKAKHSLFSPKDLLKINFTEPPQGKKFVDAYRKVKAENYTPESRVLKLIEKENPDFKRLAEMYIEEGKSIRLIIKELGISPYRALQLSSVLRYLIKDSRLSEKSKQNALQFFRSNLARKMRRSLMQLKKQEPTTIEKFAEYLKFFDNFNE